MHWASSTSITSVSSSWPSQKMPLALSAAFAMMDKERDGSTFSKESQQTLWSRVGKPGQAM